jgi:hypothetical protein
MAKKAPPAEPAPAPEASSSLADAIRAALWYLGIHSSKSEVSEWIKGKYPSLDFKDSTLTSSLSSIRKRLRGEEADSPEPTLNDLLNVQKIASENGGVDEVIGLLVRVDGIAKRAGGLDHLRKCLEGLKTLSK